MVRPDTMTRDEAAEALARLMHSTVPDSWRHLATVKIHLWEGDARDAGAPGIRIKALETILDEEGAAKLGFVLTKVYYKRDDIVFGHDDDGWYGNAAQLWLAAEEWMVIMATYRQPAPNPEVREKLARLEARIRELAEQ